MDCQKPHNGHFWAEKTIFCMQPGQGHDYDRMECN